MIRTDGAPTVAWGRIPLEPADPTPPRRTIELTDADLELLCAALDSHIYWQLSDENYRNSGYVLEPGSDDPDVAKDISEAEALLSRIEGLMRT